MSNLAASNVTKVLTKQHAKSESRYYQICSSGNTEELGVMKIVLQTQTVEDSNVPNLRDGT